MPKLLNTVRDAGSGRVAQTLKGEIERLGAAVLPLHQAIGQGGMVDDSPLAVTVLHLADRGDSIRARLGVLFSEIVGGCSCGDDPFTENVYCLLQVSIDKATAEAEFSVIPDGD